MLFTSLLVLAQFLNASSWHDDYVLALRSAPAQACTLFTRLANDRSEPIRDLAKVRAIKSCGKTDLKPLETILADANLIWLHSMAADLALNISIDKKDDAGILEYSSSAIANKRSRKDKEELLKQAIQSAKNLARPADQIKLEEDLYKLSPRLIVNPSADLWSKVAKDFQRNRQFQIASDYYLKIYKGAKNWPEKLKALDGSRRALKEKYRTGKGPISEFFSASEKFGEFAFKTLRKTSNLSLDQQRKLMLAFFQYGRDLWSYAQGLKDQKEGVRKVIKRYLNSPNTNKFLEADAWILLTRVSQNYKEWNTGVAESDKALKILNQLGSPKKWNKWQKEMYDKALWFNAHLTRKSGDLTLSYKRMLNVAANSNADWAKRRGLFWLGRTAKQLGKIAESKTHYTKLIKENPYHYYAIWAHFDGDTPITNVAPFINNNPPRPKGVSRGDHDFILSLVKATEQRLARIYLNDLVDPNSTEISELRYRSFVGDHKTVLNAFFFHMDKTQKRNLQDNYLSLLYPTPHYNLVYRQARRWTSLDHFYVYSIMRQESGFDPFSHSWADARGLLQLVPRAARGEQNRAGVTYQHVDELFIPEVNIPIGIAALDTRFKKSSNNYILATASYNAGEPRVHRWHRNLFEGDVFEFLEDIPVEETRLYVRLVARNYIRNMQLAESKPFKVPAWLFELK